MTTSSNMKAVLKIAEHPDLGRLLRPLINVERDSIAWEKLSYHVQPGGFQAALSWVYCVFCDTCPPDDWEYRDPFDSFGVMDSDLQVLAIQALALRHRLLKEKAQ